MDVEFKQPAGHIPKALRASRPPRAKDLPRGFDYAGNLSGQSEFAELNTRNTELTVVCARASAEGAAIPNPDRR